MGGHARHFARHCVTCAGCAKRAPVYGVVSDEPALGQLAGRVSHREKHARTIDRRFDIQLHAKSIRQGAGGGLQIEDFADSENAPDQIRQRQPGQHLGRCDRGELLVRRLFAFLGQDVCRAKSSEGLLVGSERGARAHQQRIVLRDDAIVGDRDQLGLRAEGEDHFGDRGTERHDADVPARRGIQGSAGADAVLDHPGGSSRQDGKEQHHHRHGQVRPSRAR